LSAAPSQYFCCLRCPSKCRKYADQLHQPSTGTERHADLYPHAAFSGIANPGAAAIAHQPWRVFQRSVDYNSQCGLLLHANAASVTANSDRNLVSMARSIINPFRGNKLHRVGFGLFWDKTSLKAVGQPRNAEWERRPITITRSSKVCVPAPTFSPLSTPPPSPGRRARGGFSPSEAPSSSDTEATHKLRHQHYTNLTQEIARMRLRVRKSVC